MRQPPRGDGARGIATARALRKCGVVWGGGDREMPAPSLRCPSGHPTSRTTATTSPPSWRCLWAPLMQREKKEKGRHEWALEGAAVGVFQQVSHDRGHQNRRYFDFRTSMEPHLHWAVTRCVWRGGACRSTAAGSGQWGGLAPCCPSGNWVTHRDIGPDVARTSRRWPRGSRRCRRRTQRRATVQEAPHSPLPAPLRKRVSTKTTSRHDAATIDVPQSP